VTLIIGKGQFLGHMIGLVFIFVSHVQLLETVLTLNWPLNLIQFLTWHSAAKHHRE